MKVDTTLLRAGLGGPANISAIVPCMSRLRVEVRDPRQVDEKQIRAAGVLGLVRTNEVLQIVLGPIANEIADQLGDPKDTINQNTPAEGYNL